MFLMFFVNFFTKRIPLLEAREKDQLKYVTVELRIPSDGSGVRIESIATAISAISISAQTTSPIIGSGFTLSPIMDLKEKIIPDTAITAPRITIIHEKFHASSSTNASTASAAHRRDARVCIL